MFCELVLKATSKEALQKTDLRLLLSCLWACHCLVRPLRGADHRTTNL